MKIGNGERIQKRRFNLSTVNKVAAVFADSDDGSPPNNRDIKIHCKSGESMELPIDFEHTDPMTYSLSYPSDGGGWFPPEKY